MNQTSRKNSSLRKSVNLQQPHQNELTVGKELSYITERANGSSYFPAIGRTPVLDIEAEQERKKEQKTNQLLEQIYSKKEVEEIQRNSMYLSIFFLPKLLLVITWMFIKKEEIDIYHGVSFIVFQLIFLVFVLKFNSQKNFQYLLEHTEANDNKKLKIYKIIFQCYIFLDLIVFVELILSQMIQKLVQESQEAAKNNQQEQNTSAFAKDISYQQILYGIMMGCHLSFYSEISISGKYQIFFSIILGEYILFRYTCNTNLLQILFQFLIISQCIRHYWLKNTQMYKAREQAKLQIHCSEIQIKLDALQLKNDYNKSLWNDFEEVPFCIITGDRLKQNIQILKANNACLAYFHKDNVEQFSEVLKFISYEKHSELNNSNIFSSQQLSIRYFEKGRPGTQEFDVSFNDNDSQLSDVSSDLKFYSILKQQTLSNFEQRNSSLHNCSFQEKCLDNYIQVRKNKRVFDVQMFKSDVNSVILFFKNNDNEKGKKKQSVVNVLTPQQQKFSPSISALSGLKKVFLKSEDNACIQSYLNQIKYPIGALQNYLEVLQFNQYKKKNLLVQNQQYIKSQQSQQQIYNNRNQFSFSNLEIKLQNEQSAVDKSIAKNTNQHIPTEKSQAANNNIQNNNIAYGIPSLLKITEGRNQEINNSYIYMEESDKNNIENENINRSVDTKPDSIKAVPLLTQQRSETEILLLNQKKSFLINNNSNSNRMLNKQSTCNSGRQGGGYLEFQFPSEKFITKQTRQNSTKLTDRKNNNTICYPPSNNEQIIDNENEKIYQMMSNFTSIINHNVDSINDFISLKNNNFKLNLSSFDLVSVLKNIIKLQKSMHSERIHLISGYNQSTTSSPLQKNESSVETIDFLNCDEKIQNGNISRDSILDGSIMVYNDLLRLKQIINTLILNGLHNFSEENIRLGYAKGQDSNSVKIFFIDSGNWLKHIYDSNHDKLQKKPDLILVQQLLKKIGPKFSLKFESAGGLHDSSNQLSFQIYITNNEDQQNINSIIIGEECELLDCQKKTTTNKEKVINDQKHLVASKGNFDRVSVSNIFGLKTSALASFDIDYDQCQEPMINRLMPYLTHYSNKLRPTSSSYEKKYEYFINMQDSPIEKQQEIGRRLLNQFNLKSIIEEDKQFMYQKAGKIFEKVQGKIVIIDSNQASKQSLQHLLSLFTQKETTSINAYNTLQDFYNSLICDSVSVGLDDKIKNDDLSLLLTKNPSIISENYYIFIDLSLLQQASMKDRKEFKIFSENIKQTQIKNKEYGDSYPNLHSQISIVLISNLQACTFSEWVDLYEYTALLFRPVDLYQILQIFSIFTSNQMKQ